MPKLPQIRKRAIRIAEPAPDPALPLAKRWLWGALSGLVLAALIISIQLDTAETAMLELHYKLASSSLFGSSKPRTSNDISLMILDDDSQYDFEITKFADRRSQHSLTELIKVLEKYDPAVIVLDLDLRGACDKDLVSLMQNYKNVAIAIFGNTDQDNELPATDPWPSGEYLEHAAHGRTQLKHESNGAVYELPIAEHAIQSLQGNQTQRLLAAEPSLIEAVLTLYKERTGVGPDVKSLRQKWMPLYLSAKQMNFPTATFKQAPQAEQSTNSADQFYKGRIIIIGTLLTQLSEQRGNVVQLRSQASHLYYQAKALETLLSGEEISTFPSWIVKVICLIIGLLAGGLFALANWPGRTLAYALASVVLILGSFGAFQFMQLNLPIVAPFAILSGAYVVSSFIAMDANLRQRNYELAIARLSMQARAEEERQRIAEDLHDETLPNLSVVARMADQLAKSMKENPVPKMMRERLDFAIAEMRRVINDLHPSVLETMGFKPALENLLATLAKDGDFQVSFHALDNFPEERLPKPTQLLLYRMVQEALNNVRKHSQAKHVEVELDGAPEFLRIAIRDDGVGIASTDSKSGSHGILNLKQRAQLIGAQVAWQRPKKYGSGTEVEIKLPLNLLAKEHA
jgi:signal transduction histidine kinase